MVEGFGRIYTSCLCGLGWKVFLYSQVYRDVVRVEFVGNRVLGR